MPPPLTPQTPAQKRKRLEVSAASLKKPFRSPLLRKPPDALTAPELARKPAGETSETPSRVTPASTTPASTSTHPPETPSKTPSRPGSARRTSGSYLTPSRLLAAPSPEVAAAQRVHSRLTLELHSLQSQLTTARQALSLERSGEDVLLEGQIWKWKHASRNAIEALFAVASEKVNARGGEWRGLFGRKKGWDEEEEAELEEVRRERERREREEEREGWGMRVMLRGLGIPEGMVGWDGVNNCWEDIG